MANEFPTCGDGYEDCLKDVQRHVDRQLKLFTEIRELKEANEWLRKAREHLIADIASLEDRLRQGPQLSYEVLRRHYSSPDEILNIVNIVEFPDAHVRITVVDRE